MSLPLLTLAVMSPSRELAARPPTRAWTYVGVLPVSRLDLQAEWRSQEQWSADDEIESCDIDFDGSGPVHAYRHRNTRLVSEERIVIERVFIEALVSASRPTDSDVPSDCRAALKWTSATSSLSATLDWGIEERTPDGQWCALVQWLEGPSLKEAAGGELRPMERKGGARLLSTLDDREGVPAGPGWIRFTRSGVVELGVEPGRNRVTSVLCAVNADGDVYFWCQ